MNIIVFHQVGCKTRLAEVYLDKIRQNQSLKVCAQEPFDRAHEIHLDMFFEESLKLSFDVWIFQEVYKVVNVEAKSEMVMGRGSIRVGRINDITTKEARIVCVLSKAELE